MKLVAIHACRPAVRSSSLLRRAMPDRFLAVIGLLCGATHLVGSNLVDNSPFIPDGFSASKRSDKKTQQNRKSVPTRDIELRGVYSINGEYHFNIYNKKDRKGEWMGLNDPSSAYRILRFDEDTSSIQITLDGETEELSLKEPDNKPLPVRTASIQAPSGDRRNASRASTPTATRAQTRQETDTDRSPVVRRRVIVPNREGGRNKNRSSNSRTQRPPRRGPAKPPQNAQDLINNLQRNQDFENQ